MTDPAPCQLLQVNVAELYYLLEVAAGRVRISPRSGLYTHNGGIDSWAHGCLGALERKALITQVGPWIVVTDAGRHIIGVARGIADTVRKAERAARRRAKKKGRTNA